MKRLAVMLTVIMLLFCGCNGTIRSGIVEGDVPSLDGNAAFSAKSSFSGWIMGINGTSILLCGTSSSDLFWVSTEDIPICDSRGDSMDFSRLTISDTVDVTYDGGIMESYPGMFSGISGIRVTGRKNTLVPFYMQVLNDVYQTDTALNSNAEMLAFDLSQTTNLTESEKNAFLYLSGNKYGKEAFFASYDDLKEQGYLSEDGLFFENGVLITIVVSEVGLDDGFEFSVSKWRSGTGAVGYSECIAKKKKDSWTYEPGGAWIS